MAENARQIHVRSIRQIAEDIHAADRDLRTMEGDLVTARARAGYLERTIPHARQRLRDLHAERDAAEMGVRTNDFEERRRGR